VASVDLVQKLISQLASDFGAKPISKTPLLKVSVESEQIKKVAGFFLDHGFSIFDGVSIRPEEERACLNYFFFNPSDQVEASVEVRVEREGHLNSILPKYPSAEFHEAELVRLLNLKVKGNPSLPFFEGASDGPSS